MKSNFYKLKVFVLATLAVFLTLGSSAQAPTLVYPANGATNVALDADLSWTAPAWNSWTYGYKVTLGTAADPISVLNGQYVDGRNNTNLPIARLTPATTYYWSVASQRGYWWFWSWVDLPSASSPVYSFTTVGVGDMHGYVQDGFGVPVENARVSLMKNNVEWYYAITDHEGAYDIDNAEAFMYDVVVSKPNYNNTILEDVTITADGMVHQNFILQRPILAVTPNPFNVTVNPNELFFSKLNLENKGDGVTTWTASISENGGKILLGEVTGTLEGFKNFDIPLTFKAAGLEAGTVIQAIITVTATPNIEVEVPVTMTVSGTDFNYPVNFTATLVDQITGKVRLTWGTDRSVFQYWSIKRGDVEIAKVQGSPFEEILPTYGTYTYTLQAIYDDGFSAPVTATVEWPNPTLEIATALPLTGEVWKEGELTRTLVLKNTGDGTLTYNFTGLGTFVKSVDPVSGQIAADGQATITLYWDATGLTPEQVYSQNIVLHTNDLAHPTTQIENVLEVHTPALFKGIVTDVTTNKPLVGVVVTANGYETVTLEDGSYSLQVSAGAHDLVFTKTGYMQSTYPAVAIAWNETKTFNEKLRENSYEPAFVDVVVNALDTEATVNWGDASGLYDIIYDDGAADNFTAWELAGNMNAVKFTPADYPATVNGARIFVGDGSFPENNTGILGAKIKIYILDDDGANGMPGTILDKKEVSVNNYGWFTYTGFKNEITAGNFYIAIEQLTSEPNAIPIGVDTDLPTTYRSYSKFVTAGESWKLSPYQDLMIRALVTGSPFPDEDLLTKANTEILVPSAQAGTISKAPVVMPLGGVEGTGTFVMATDLSDNRAVTSYEVVRYDNIDPDLASSTWTIDKRLDTLGGNTLLDKTWAKLTAGWHAYGVRAFYPGNNASVYKISKPVGHLIDAKLTVNVSLTTGECPEGAEITLVGHDYPYMDETFTVPESHQVVIPVVYFGDYTLTATMEGYDDFTIDFTIDADREIKVVLKETKYIPTDLTVDEKTLVANWKAPKFVVFEEKFNGKVFPPKGWQVVNIGHDTTTWEAAPKGEFAQLYTGHYRTSERIDYLITPEMNLTDSESYELRFTSYYRSTWGQKAYVEMSEDCGKTWEKIYQVEESDDDRVAGPNKEIVIDLTEYSGEHGLKSAMFAFVSYDKNHHHKALLWAIDNVTFRKGIDPRNGYGVFLDGALVANVDATTYTFKDLNYGQKYLAGVAGYYSSGYSEMDTYEFTAKYLTPATNLKGVNTVGTDFVKLTWSAPDDGTLTSTKKKVSGLIGYNIYKDGSFLAYVPYPALEYNDLDLNPGTYEYAITAKYDLSYVGIMGTDESLKTAPVKVKVIYGYTLPFVENFDNGYKVNQWTVGDNWRIAGQMGNPLPAAEFNYDPRKTDYSLALTSSWINGTGFTDGEFFLDFDLKLDDINATGKELFVVEVYNGVKWIAIDTTIAKGDMNWVCKHLNITSMAKDKVFNFRFVAKGKNTLDIIYWLVDNIHVYRSCDGPSTLTASVNEAMSDQVQLSWVAPETEVTSYNVYRNDVLIATTLERSYLDADPAISVKGLEVTYKVTAEYATCESEFSNDAHVVITANKDVELNVLGIYPNPSSDVVNIQVTNKVREFTVYNYLGQVVESKAVTSENMQLNVRNYKSGGYLIKFMTQDGDSFTKKFVVANN